jgi:hypothetical protein
LNPLPLCWQQLNPSLRALALALGVVASMPASAQVPLELADPADVRSPPMAATFEWLIPDESYPHPGAGIPAPYAWCYRVGRCSAYDLYRFRDRPNRLTRLVPVPWDAPARHASIRYGWFFVPVTPKENILPKYRAASQVRDEYRAVGRPIDEPN